MVFMVNPSEAQALQEDEAQLLAAIAQASRSLQGLLHSPHIPSTDSVSQPVEQLRVQMGRRVVYGKLADGPFRNELDSNSLKVIFDAIQRPVTEGADLSDYQSKVPAVEIRNGDSILFREERDGTITVNEIQFQTEKAPTLEHTSPVADEATTTVQEPSKTVAVAQVTDFLLNPLGDEIPLYDAVSLQGYRIVREGDRVTISKNGELVLVEQNSEVIVDRVTQQDWEVFQNLQQSWELHENIPLDEQFNDAAPQLVQEHEQLAASANHIAETAQAVPPAIAILERETDKLPDGKTKEFLQATTQTWKQQLQEGLMTGIQQSFNWLTARPEVLRNQSLAQAALDLFNRGYERTGERSYQVGEYIINFKGGSLYTVRDAKGELMRFQAFKSSIPVFGRQQVKVLAVSDRLSEFQRKDLLAMQHDKSLTPQGDLDIEANYAAKTRRVEQTVRAFLRNHARATIWDKEGGTFKLEAGEGYLCITDKQNGRGIVFQRQHGEVSSKLSAKDFAHFERLATRMQQVAQQQPQSKVSSWFPQRSPGMVLE